ncbi:hypothetical protein, partial [Stenotrophomonas pictorum]|uniref:hypothetical protein n=1 Tax=Stenotrophomonas pictorum TaxID=86184 RepID=UPI001C469EAD
MVDADHLLVARERFPVDADHFLLVHDRFMVDVDHFSVAVERFSFGADRFLVDCPENGCNGAHGAPGGKGWPVAAAQTTTPARGRRCRRDRCGGSAG